MPGFLLHLAGPMQSWADTGFGQLREAGPFPSRAGVLGIVAAALGIPRADVRLVDLHDAFRVHVATAREGEVRRDFHTVETVPGKAPTLTRRAYHHDAHFVALVESDDGHAAETAIRALRDPVFSTFLGRRSCPPSVPLLPLPVGEAPFSSLLTSAVNAREHLPGIEGRRPRGQRSGGRRPIPVYLDGHYDPLPASLTGTSHAVSYGTRRDRLVAPRRAYTDRPYTNALIDVPE